MSNIENQSPLFKVTIIYALLICAVFFLPAVDLHFSFRDFDFSMHNFGIYFNIVACCFISFYINNSILRNAGDDLSYFVHIVMKVSNIYIILFAILSLYNPIILFGLPILYVDLIIVAALLGATSVEQIYKK